MIYDYHVVLGVVGSLVGIASYVPYFRDIFRGTTKPHPFSWFVWGIITSVVLLAQVLNGAGVGAWISAITLIACFLIAAIALRHGEKRITALDWWCFSLALAGIALWRLTSEPLVAVFMVTFADIIMYVPTIRKSYWKPGEETLSTWVLNTIKWFLSAASLQTITFTTALFPIAIVFTNIFFIAMVLIRRRQLKAASV